MDAESVYAKNDKDFKKERSEPKVYRSFRLQQVLDDDL